MNPRPAAAIHVERKLPGFGQGWTWRIPQCGQQSGQIPKNTHFGQTGQTEKTNEKTGCFDPPVSSVANICACGQTHETDDSESVAAARETDGLRAEETIS